MKISAMIEVPREVGDAEVVELAETVPVPDKCVHSGGVVTAEVGE